MVRCPSADYSRYMKEQEDSIMFACSPCPFNKMVWEKNDSAIVENCCNDPKKCYQLLSKELDTNNKNQRLSNEELVDKLELNDNQKESLKNRLNMIDLFLKWEGVQQSYLYKNEIFEDSEEYLEFQKDLKKYDELKKRENWEV